MQKKTKVLLGSVLGAALVAGIAIATPTIDAFYNVVLSTGTINRNILAYAEVPLGKTERWERWEHKFRVALETEGPSNIIQQEVKFSPSGTTGWHSHPGLLLLTLAADSGPVDWYDAECHKTVYHAGDTWTEGTTLHDVVNSSSMDAHFLITYVIAKGMEKRLDESAPGCAAAHNLE